MAHVVANLFQDTPDQVVASQEHQMAEKLQMMVASALGSVVSSLKGSFEELVEEHKGALFASVKEIASMLKEECVKLEAESSSDHMNTLQEQTARNVQEIMDCRTKLEDRARLMHVQQVQEIDELRMTLETQLENQKFDFLDQETKLEGQECAFCRQRSNEVRKHRMSMDRLIAAHDQELEKFRQELELSKGDVAQQAKVILELSDKLLDNELRAQEKLNSTLTRPSTKPFQRATTTTATAYRDSSSQQDVLSSAFSRTPRTQKDMISLSPSRISELMSTTAIPVTNSSEGIPAVDFDSEAATCPPLRTEGMLDPARAPYLDSVEVNHVSDWITCPAPTPEATGMPFRGLQNRLGLFTPDMLVKADEFEKARHCLSLTANSFQDLKDAVRVLDSQYDSNANGVRGIQVKDLVQAVLTNPRNVLPPRTEYWNCFGPSGL